MWKPSQIKGWTPSPAYQKNKKAENAKMFTCTWQRLNEPTIVFGGKKAK